MPPMVLKMCSMALTGAAYVDIVKLLLDAGACRNVTDKWGDTPESEARSNGHDETVALLTQ